MPSISAFTDSESDLFTKRSRSRAITRKRVCNRCSRCFFRCWRRLSEAFSFLACSSRDIRVLPSIHEHNLHVNTTLRIIYPFKVVTQSLQVVASGSRGFMTKRRFCSQTNLIQKSHLRKWEMFHVVFDCWLARSWVHSSCVFECKQMCSSSSTSRSSSASRRLVLHFALRVPPREKNIIHGETQGEYV